MRFWILPFLPLISAIQLPHLSTPQSSFQAADVFLHSTSHLSNASDMKLGSVPGDNHVVITSALHPNHRIRIKSTEGWCDPSVRSYSGYLDTGFGKDLFFYFFESRTKPEEAPVIMWINGGPGCSSAIGLFMELGPCTIKDNPTSVNDTKVNPYAWNENANIFFLDEPLGVGYSYAEHGQHVARTEEAAKDVQAFVSLFFENFKEFEGRAFHMAGESYAGRFLPVFASAVYDGNKALVAEGKTPVNLQSVMIGNGITSFISTTESYYPYLCTIQDGRNQTVASISTCVAMAEAVPKCDRLYRHGCLETNDYTTCSMAVKYCYDILAIPWGINPYDISKTCTIEQYYDSLCYNSTKKIRTYLDLPDTRRALGVSDKRANWSSCNYDILRDFGAALDNTGQTWLYVANLLERDVRVLNYVGTFDYVCNHIGNERWMEALEWTGQKEYNAAQFVPWKVDGEVAGIYKNSGNLTMLKITGAGHMVPMDKPKEALTMLNEWLNS